MGSSHREHVKVGKAAPACPSLTVNVSPERGLRPPDRPVAVAKLWLRQPELGLDAARAMHRVLAMHMDAFDDGGVPLVVDVRRERANLLGKRRFKRGFDDMLRSEAVGTETRWMSLVRSA